MYRVYRPSVDLDNCVLITRKWEDASKLAKAMNSSAITFDNGKAEALLTAHFVSEADSLRLIVRST